MSTYLQIYIALLYNSYYIFPLHMSGAEIKRIDPREHVLLRPDMYVGSL